MSPHKTIIEKLRKIHMDQNYNIHFEEIKNWIAQETDNKRYNPNFETKIKFNASERSFRGSSKTIRPRSLENRCICFAIFKFSRLQIYYQQAKNFGGGMGYLILPVIFVWTRIYSDH